MGLMSKRRRARSRALAPLWTEIELAFFAAAPPDDPAPVAQPEPFEDDRRLSFWAALRRLFSRSRQEPDQTEMRAARSSSLLA